MVENTVFLFQSEIETRLPNGLHIIGIKVVVFFFLNLIS